MATTRPTVAHVTGRPRVTIGIPVHNGENFLDEAIRSVRAQTFQDLEIVVSDNASTDRTPEIVARHAAQDPRIVSFRQPRNVGAWANFRRCLELARGDHFKWLAHDDRIEPRYLEAAVAALDASPDAVLCNAVVDYIDAQGKPIDTYDSGLGEANRPRPSERFAAMILRSHSCVDFFGLYRRDRMVQPLPPGDFHGIDRAFLAWMALRGRFVQIPEHLVRMREHPNRYTRRHLRPGDRAAWHDPSRTGRLNLPAWRLYREYCAMVGSEPLAATERLRCGLALAAWWVRNWNTVRVLVDLLALVSPDAVGVAERVKSRLFGDAPGHFRGWSMPGREDATSAGRSAEKPLR